jgi:uncharacterized caspase-like protein
MVRVDEIVSDMQQAKNLRILVLDSCRDNPLADELKRAIGHTRAPPLQRGLAKLDSPQGMIVSYATQSARCMMATMASSSVAFPTAKSTSARGAFEVRIRMNQA